MTIQRKIRLSNILMILIPVITTVLLVAVSLQTSLGNYWYSMEMMYQDENGIQSAQSLIYTYQQELWENNWGSETPKEIGEPIRQSEKMYHLEGKLDKMGYHIMVKKNGNVIYSNFEEADREAARRTGGEALCEARTMTVSSGNVSVVKNTFDYQDKTFSVIAVNLGQANEGQSYLQAYILKYFFLFCGTFFVMVILVNVVLSFWVSRSVLEPLEILSNGTKRIIAGELETELDYHKTDEFGEVCRDFEEMCRYLKQSVDQRLENEEQKVEMIRGISHDLRTPLTSIGGYVDGLLDGIANTPEKRKRYLNAIKIRTQDMRRLVDSLSDYSRLGAGRMKYRMTPGDLKCFLEQYMGTYAEDARHNGVEFYLEAEEPSYPCLLDGEEMKRVMDNLLSNTIRYRIGEQSRVRLSLKRKDQGSWIVMEYGDDGPGVPQHCLKRIFETFYRVDSARSHAGEGSGIGLAVVRKIIEEHGGTVWAKNENGLVIVIELPEGKEGV